jgi:hypothetical protein
MDPFEEFEFKPLTEGLGFHKKAETIKADVQAADLAGPTLSRSIPNVPKSLLKSKDSESLHLGAGEARPARQSLDELLASLSPALDFADPQPAPVIKEQAARELPESSRPKIHYPLSSEKSARNSFAATTALPPVNSTAPTSSPAPVAASPAPLARTSSGSVTGRSQSPQASKNSQKPMSLHESYSKAFPRVEIEKNQARATDFAKVELVKVAVSVPSVILDALVVLGFSTICLVCIIMITHADLVGLLSNAKTDGPVQVQLVVLYLAIMQLYVLSTRCFFGATLGEWAFELQMGTVGEQQKAVYPLQILLRSVLVTLTGLILFPILSLIMKRDTLARLTGLQLFRRL